MDRGALCSQHNVLDMAGHTCTFRAACLRTQGGVNANMDKKFRRDNKIRKEEQASIRMAKRSTRGREDDVLEVGHGLGHRARQVLAHVEALAAQPPIRCRPARQHRAILLHASLVH